jgi:hypothetical protein
MDHSQHPFIVGYMLSSCATSAGSRYWSGALELLWTCNALFITGELITFMVLAQRNVQQSTY